ncbi:MAG: hypothetical protein KDK66_08875, partial [Deltaproteobacteria bacterium]|nr:hypothetical protein [Deltaproteobacteria bacterium]
EQPFPSGTTLTTGGNTTFNVVREDVGITLKVTPQVNAGDMVVLKLKQEMTSVIPGASHTVLTSLGPSTSKRSVETTVAAKDQQTIVIGGLIDDKVTMTTTKIPFLGDIPILGHLFKRKTTAKVKTNILIFVRPYIISDTKDYAKILQRKVEERNMFISQNYGKRQAKLIHQAIRSHAADLLEFKKEVQRMDWDYPNGKNKGLAPVGYSSSHHDSSEELLRAAGKDASGNQKSSKKADTEEEIFY